MVAGATFIYHDWAFPIVGNRVSLPDCTSFGVSPEGVLSGEARTPDCTPGKGAPKAIRFRGQVQQRTLADGRVVTIAIDPDRPDHITTIDDGRSTVPASRASGRPAGQTTANPFKLDAPVDSGAVAKPGTDPKACDPTLKPGTTPAPGAKPPCPPKKAPNS